MRVRAATIGLLVLSGVICGSSLTAGGSLAAPAPPNEGSAVAQQSPVPRFSTIPPLPPTLLYAGLYTGLGVLIWRWATASGWSDLHTPALTTGVLLTYML